MSSNTLEICLVQMDIAWENPASNIRQLESRLQFDHHPDLILLPEMWSTGFSMRPEVVAEDHPGPALHWMIAHSQKVNAVIAGSLSVRDEGKYYNRWYSVHPEGHINWYDKRHLFSFGKEDQHYTPGNQRVIIDLKGWKIMPVVCYDVRFPVWCRNNLDYDIMVVAANWPATRIQHWDTLLKARAIENQSYIAAVNRVGRDENGLDYPGHSTIYDMSGNAILEMQSTAGICTWSLDYALLQQYRDHFRFLQDRDAFTVVLE